MKQKANWTRLFPKSHTNTWEVSGPGLSWDLLRSWVCRATDHLVPWIMPSRRRMCQVDSFRGCAGTEQREVRAASCHHESSRHPRVQVLRHGAAAAPGEKAMLGE